MSSAFIRSAKSAPALAPPLPVLLHHSFLPPLCDQLAGSCSSHTSVSCVRGRWGWGRTLARRLPWWVLTVPVSCHRPGGPTNHADIPPFQNASLIPE